MSHFKVSLNGLILIPVHSSTSFVCALKCVCEVIPFISVCLVGYSAAELFTHTPHRPSDRSGLAVRQGERGE